MRSIMILALFGLSVFAQAAQADKVTVRGVHLCCGACVAGATKALDGIKGISDIACDANSKTVNFVAADDDAAKAGLAGLAKDGFFGAAAHGKNEIKFPIVPIKKGSKSDKVKFYGLHLCCGACVTGAQKSVQSLDNIMSIDIDRKEGTLTLSGKDIIVADALTALNKGGFYGSLKKPEVAKPVEKKKPTVKK
ncbi:MAG: hypothetical protein O3A00_22510 [Planctomycetota bacterium]|nr:hypothetical protein [Planctomycetota bacterium]